MEKPGKSRIKALEMLNNAGFEAYLVGGSVRDIVMGKAPGDTDITTNALPRQTEKVFRNFKVVKTGLKHGTVTVFIEGEPAEITTYRTEGEYTDLRHPDNVTFTRSLNLDLQRRDFTVNALCMDKNGDIVDLHGGMADIDKRIIRCVGDPEKRFAEDPLRILRAVRFRSTLGFEIEENTCRAAENKAYLIEKISRERVYSEFKKAVVGDYFPTVLEQYRNILNVCLPGVLAMKGFDQKNQHHIYDVLTHTSKVIENVPPVYPLKAAALFHDIGKPRTFTVDEKGTGHFYGHDKVSARITNEILTKLKAPGEEKDLISHLVLYHDTAIEPTEKGVRRALNKHGETVLRMLLRLKRRDNLGQNYRVYNHSRYYDEIEQLIDRQIAKEACFSLRQLAVNGRNLQEIGVKPSPFTGKILNTLLQKVIDGELPNDKQSLLEFAKTMIKQKE